MSSEILAVNKPSLRFFIVVRWDLDLYSLSRQVPAIKSLIGKRTG